MLQPATGKDEARSFGEAITFAVARWFCKSVFDNRILPFLECSLKLTSATVSIELKGRSRAIAQNLTRSHTTSPHVTTAAQ